MVGDGDRKATLQEQARSLNIEPLVRFAGFRNQTELPRFYDLCDVFVLPSKLEPWGLVVNEVMNAGRAVIVSDQVGAAADLVRNGENGFVYPAGDVDALTGALRQILSDPEQCRHMGERSRQIISTRPDRPNRAITVITTNVPCTFWRVSASIRSNVRDTSRMPLRSPSCQSVFGESGWVLWQ